MPPVSVVEPLVSLILAQRGCFLPLSALLPFVSKIIT